MRLPARFLYGLGADFAIRRLYDLGLRCVFSVPGSQVLPLWEAASRFPDLRLVVPRTERSAAFMGEGYGAAAGSGTAPAAVISTLGPGVANEAVGMFSAKAGGVPVFFLAPCQPSSKRERLPEVFQGLDQPRFFATLSKEQFLVSDAAELSGKIEEAFSACARAPAGPVRVDVEFPILFQRRLFRLPKTDQDPARDSAPSGNMRSAPSPGPAGTRPAWVLETPSLPDDWAARLGMPGSEIRALSPGIGTPGFGVPFSLGAKFTLPDSPVALVTEPGFLLDHLDSLLTARAHGVAATVIVEEGADLGTLERAAARFGAGVIRAKPGAMRGAFPADPSAWILCCLMR